MSNDSFIEEIGDSEEDSFDAASKATRWSSKAKRDKQVPLPGASMQEARKSGMCTTDAANNYVNHKEYSKEFLEQEFRQNLDASTGATPGVRSACKDLDMDNVDKVSERLGIKPPGQS